MSKKSAILIIILVIVVGTGILYFLLGGKAPNGLPIIGNPFGNPPSGTSTNGSGGNSSNSGGNTGGNGGQSNGENGEQQAALFKISDGPIAGAVSFSKNGTEFIRYVDRATGHVNEMNLSTQSKSEITNVTRPQVYEALWKTDGTGYIERTLQNGSDVIINTSISLIPPASSSTGNLYTPKATLLNGDVGDVIVNSDSTLVYNLIDSGAVSTSSFVGSKPKTLLTLPFTAWRILPINTSQALLFTKPSSSVSGYAYTLNLNSGVMSKVLGPLNGLTVLPSPDGKRLAYEFNDSNGPAMNVETISSGAITSIIPVTLPEKCIWSKKVSNIIICGAPSGGLSSNVPDSWYQGAVSYSDKIWRFNVDTDTTELLIDPSGGFSVNLDVMNPILSPNEDYLFFINKNDLNLWAVKLVP